MGCSSQDLMTALCTHNIQADEDTIAKNLTLRQVCYVFEHFIVPFSLCVWGGSGVG